MGAQKDAQKELPGGGEGDYPARDWSLFGDPTGAERPMWIAPRSVTRRRHLLALPVFAVAALCASAQAAMELDDQGPLLIAGDFRMRVSNAGVLGNPFPERSFDPSFEYPAGTGLELMRCASLWVGALDHTGRARVSGAPLLEWRPTLGAADTVHEAWHGRFGGTWNFDDDGDGRIDEEFLNGRDDDGDSEADEDLGVRGQQVLTAEYADNQPEAVAYLYPGYERHEPLGLAVRQVALAWSWPGYRSIAGLAYTVTNIGDQVLRSVHAGVEVDFDIRTALSDGSSFDDVALVNGRPTVTELARPEVASVSIVPVSYSPRPNGSTYRTLLMCRERAPTAGGYPHIDQERYAALAGQWQQSPLDYRGDQVLLVSCGPFPELAPGQSIHFELALVAAVGLDSLQAVMARAGSWSSIPFAPPGPNVSIVGGDHEVRIAWDNLPEVLVPGGKAGPGIGQFVGYNLYRLRDWSDRRSLLPPHEQFALLASYGFDEKDDQLLLSSVTDSTVDYSHIWFDRPYYPIGRYAVIDREVLNGFDYVYGVATVMEFDRSIAGFPQFERVESPMAISFAQRVRPLAAARSVPSVWVVPNPFRGRSGWDRPVVRGDAVTRHVDFMGLPRSRCTIRIWTLAGDLVASIEHDGSGGAGQAAWDLVSRNGEEVSSGLYVFTVDSPLGQATGRFVVIR